jgi:hypothetical protein
MTVEVTPITDADTAAVASYLHHNLNNQISPAQWVDAMSGSWKTSAPNYGFMLRDGERVVGAYLALYSERTIAGQTERFCNLASWSVRPEFRIHSVRLLKALLAQDGYHFTDLAPMGNVIRINARMKFRFLDTSAVVLPNLPRPTLPHRTKISADPDVIASTLTGAELEVYRDHAHAAAVNHLVLIRGGEHCYVMFRRRWWRRKPVFAAVLYVSNPELFRRVTGSLTRHLLIRHRVLVTLVERRIVGRRPRSSVPLPHPNALPSKDGSWLSRTYATRYYGTIPPKMYHSASLEPAQIDDLYSELVCVGRW